MRVVQIIDSLEAGGAEQMAVNYANALSERVAFSGLIVTRREGALLQQIDPKTSYLFLKKKKIIDIKVVLQLKNYLKKNNVCLIHAHSSSFFIAVLLKIISPGIKIIWHDHLGKRVTQTKKNNRILILFSSFFNSIVTVNPQLLDWNKKHLLCSDVSFLPNFVKTKIEFQKLTFLKGTDLKRIVCIANLKEPKNHIAILKAFLNLNLKDSDWTLHLIGHDYFDDYSENLKKFIKEHSLGNHIYLYGSRNDVAHILSQAAIGVLASTQEGFPVVLLEYGLANVPVLSTNAGYCSLLIKNHFNGLLFDPNKKGELENQLHYLLLCDEEEKKLYSKNMKQIVMESYSEETVVQKLIKVYKNCQNEK
nr:glycosyltransferase [uncultured Flavobacterium sp.]